jgi:hypothetical protein
MNDRLLFWGIYSHRLSRIRVPRGKLGVSFELWIKMARTVVAAEPFPFHLAVNTRRG